MGSIYLENFIDSLTDTECKEIVNPQKYKRGCGKKKEDFVNEQLENLFAAFVSKYPIDSF